jgi:hypothetical protein
VPRTSHRRRNDDETDDYLDASDEGDSRRGRRRDEDADEGESRRRTKRSRDSADEEDEDADDEEERPRSRRRSSGDTDDHSGGLDEFANRRDRRSRSSEDDDDRASRDRGGRSSRSSDRGGSRGRGGRDDDRGGRSERRSKTEARKGWGGYRQTADSVKSDFADNLKIIDNTDMLIKILDEEPVASYAEHWLTIKDGKEEKRRSFVCLGDDCPLCNKLGDRASVKVCFNVADMDVNPPEVKLWTAGTQVGDILEKFAENPKTSPLNRDDIYWTITRTKKNERYTTSVRPVKARDLEEDFDMEPLTEEELDELEGNLFTPEQIYSPKTKAELNAVIKDNDLDDAY